MGLRSVFAGWTRAVGSGLDLPGAARTAATPAALLPEAGDQVYPCDENDAEGDEKVEIHGDSVKSLS